MTKAKHTPGPWIATDVPHVQTDMARVGFLTTVADCRIGGHSHDEMVANAHLIAAAPAMLEALEALYEATPDNFGGPLGDACVKARAAIAKARGEAV